MEIRKLQKIKGGSFTLTIPKQWVEKRKLTSGEQIAVSEDEDGSLRLGSGYGKTFGSDAAARRLPRSYRSRILCRNLLHSRKQPNQHLLQKDNSSRTKTKA